MWDNRDEPVSAGQMTGGAGKVLVGVVGAFLLVIAAFALVSWLTRDEASFVLRVTAITADEVCVERPNTAPVVNPCNPRNTIVGLPSDIFAGDCIVVSGAHPLLDYVGRVVCPNTDAHRRSVQRNAGMTVSAMSLVFSST